MISLLDLINDLDPQINNFKIDDDSSSKNPLKKLDKVMTESFIIKQDLIKVGFKSRKGPVYLKVGFFSLLLKKIPRTQ